MSGEPNEGPGPVKVPSVAARLARIALGALAVYVITLLLTTLFWAGMLNPNGPAAIAAAVFVVFAVYLSIRLGSHFPTPGGQGALPPQDETAEPDDRPIGTNR